VLLAWLVTLLLVLLEYLFVFHLLVPIEDAVALLPLAVSRGVDVPLTLIVILIVVLIPVRAILIVVFRGAAPRL
jgi:hypothetical protein